MNVGFSLLTLLPGAVGGSESYVRGVLRELGAGRHRVTVLANAHVERAYGDFVTDRVELHRVRSYRTGTSGPTRAAAMSAARAFPRAVARDVPDGLDVVHYPVTVPIPQTDGPRVVTIHDLQHHELPELFSRAERAFRRWAYDGAAQRATRVVAISEHTKREVVDRLGVDPERVDVIHPGVDPDRFAPEGDDAPLDALDLPERFVFYPANLWPHKNHERLLEALARSADPELSLVLSGQRYGRGERVMRRARELGVADRVRHVGFVPGDALPGLYRRAFGLVFPSLHEGFGMPPVEAMACGCPVAAARAASLPEVCGDAALLFDPLDVDAIAAALEELGSEELRASLQERGLRRAREFRWPAAARRHEEVYEHAAA
jgi:glycosyltransferase involved in cell wall biosynthesis